MESLQGTSASGSPCPCSPGLWPGRHSWEEYKRRSQVLAVCCEWGWGPGVARALCTRPSQICTTVFPTPGALLTHKQRQRG